MMQTILGIDPGSRITGYGIIQSNGLRHRYLACGCIKITATDLGPRLQQIFDGLRDVIFQYQPQQAAIEKVFMHQNAGSALILGQARGAAIVVAAIHELTVAEYSARQIKQAVVGYGAAEKQQVQKMVTTLLQLSQQPTVDAADALAVAICHANSSFGLSRMKKGSKIRRGRLL